MLFLNIKGAFTRTFFYSYYSHLQLLYSKFFVDSSLQQNQAARTNRASICVSICQVMILVIVLQSFKLIAINNNFPPLYMRLHLLNLGIHLCLFWLSLVVLKRQHFSAGRTLFIFSFCSYLSIASLLWQYDLRLQYYFLLALFITTYLIDSHEKSLLLVCISYQLIAFVGLSWYLPNLDEVLRDEASSSLHGSLHKLALINTVVFALSCCICALFIRVILSQNWQQLRAYEKQQQLLIDRIFPNDLGSELLALTGTKQAHLFQHKPMAVLFLDICGFTQRLFTQQTNWQSIYALFAEFDKITAHLDVRRIKTNGDQYILVIGMQSEHLDEKEIAQQALDASILLAEHTRTVGKFSVRQGLSFGQVIYGIFDINNPVFDVWGETVVTAARLEAFATPDQILVDHTLYLSTRGNITFSPCIRVNLKGIGLTKAYAVTRT